jgi:hypothetical protein
MSSFEMNLSNTDDITDDIIINNKKDIFDIREAINIIINNILKSIYKIKDNNFSKTINDYLSKIINIFDIIINSLNIHINSKNEIEKAQRKDENTIRNLYEKYFHEQLINEILENKILNLTKKEKEYELLKQKTGAIISNGKVICNDRKENEIIILRTENSLLKSTIKNNEDLITEKNDIINNLNNDILLYRNEIEELHKMKNGEYSSFSNINININESKHNYKTKIITNSNRKHSENKNKSLHKENKCPNNMYSSYKNNTKLMNKARNDSFQKYKKVKTINNNEKSKEKSNPKAFRKSNDYTIDINAINNNSIKTIAVNKSKLFSPNKCLTIKRKIYNKYSNPTQMKNLIVNNNSKSKDYNTATIDSQKRREIKRKPIKKKFFGNHRKANSIQILDNSLKKLSNNRKNEKCLSNSKNNRSNNLFSVLRKIIEIKNKNLIKNTPQSSLVNNTFLNNSKKNKKINEDNQGNTINHAMIPYADKRKGNGNRGRNEKYVDKNTDSVSFMNKTTYDNYSNNDKNNLNAYYNSIDFSDINQMGKK